ncbi:MAG: hypothetical protein AABX50_00570, partial [Nanoarchaeota archaeon]
VLPIALNRACKLTGFFLGEDKEYVGIMRIHEPVPDEELEKAIKDFTGKIKQLPPVKSRVARVVREREIKSFEILEKDGQNFLFRVECQGGTYIRKLVHDLGGHLNVGAHMLELRRIRAGIFKEEKSCNLYDFEKAVGEYKKGNEELLRKIISPGEIIIELYQEIQINPDSAERILRGQPIYKKNLVKEEKVKKDEKICIFSDSRFIGVYWVVSEDRIFAKPEFVFQPI